MKRVMAGLFLLLGCCCPVASAAPAHSVEEQAAWLAASASDAPNGYSEFLQKFPDGTFAPLARIRLGETGLSANDGASISSTADLPTFDKRYVQRRSISPRLKPRCLSDPDAACLLFEIEKLIPTVEEPTSRLEDLASLARGLAAAGDVAGGLKYLQQAASLARGLSGTDKVHNLGVVGTAAAMAGNAQASSDFLKEALTSARAIATAKSNRDSLRESCRALTDIASQFAMLGNTDDATRLFAEAQSLALRLEPVYRMSMLQDIAEQEAKSGLLQNAFLILSDLLIQINEMPQMSAFGTIAILGRYYDMGKTADLLASFGQDTAATALARSIGPVILRVSKLLSVRDKLNGTGARDLAGLDGEIRDVAREAAKAKDGWISATDIGCALVRFGSLNEGISTARTLFARATANPFYYSSQRQFVECIAQNIGPGQAADFLVTTRMQSDPKAQSDFKSAVEEIANAYAQQGDIDAAKEWTDKLSQSDRSSAYTSALSSFEESKRKRVARLCFALKFKEAIAEARQLKETPDAAFGDIVEKAAKATDLDSALEAARAISDNRSKIAAYTALLAPL